MKLDNKLKIVLFKFINTPISLSLTNREWYSISRDPCARAEWLIYKYGRAHALFHAVRLGNNFITVEVIGELLSKNAIISRYFVQRLLMHFGIHDEQLKRERNAHNQVDSSRINPFQPSPWASKLSPTIFTTLLTEGYKILNDADLATKGNDMELFILLSGGPFFVDLVPQKLNQNLDSSIEDLILNKKFMPFPTRPIPIYEDTIEYIQLIQARSHEDNNNSSKDGYENSQQLNDVTKAILIHPDLVTLWKKIGYCEICSDFNELVMQGILLSLFPYNPSSDWVCPDLNSVVASLKHLINVGFKLTDTVMEEAFRSFENRLSEIGDLMMNSFQEIHKVLRSDIACSCLTQTIKPEINHENTDLLEFLINRVDQPEEALDNALKYYNVGFKLDVDSIQTTKKIRSLSVHSNIYYWILKKYGPNSKITQKCFEDIIESRIWIDLRLQETPERNIPEKLTSSAFNSICSIYLEFCNEKVPYQTNYLSYLQLVKSEEIIKPFFGVCLSTIFGLQSKCKLPYEINYEYIRPKVNGTHNNKRKFNEMNDQPDNRMMEEWFKLFDDIHFGPINANNSKISDNFKKIFEDFWDKINPSLLSSTVSTESTSERPTKLIK